MGVINDLHSATHGRGKEIQGLYRPPPAVPSGEGEGPSAENVDKVKVSQKRDREVQLKDNRFWLAALGNHWWFKTDPRLILELDALVDRLDAGLIAARARATFGKDYVLGVLKPEK